MTSIYAHNVPFDYRYPMADRKQLMSSMQNFNDVVKTSSQNKSLTYRPSHLRSVSLNNRDIQGSFYQKPKEKFNRPNFINKVDDIDIGKKLNKQPDNENNSDVYKKANFIYKKTPGKIFNPINPSIPILTKIYKQKTEKEEPVVQNYLIGTINKSAYDNLMTRTHYPNNGIDTKKIQQKEYKNKYDNLKVEDINTGEKKQKAYRNTNPLWPEYNITIDKNKGMELYGKIEKTSPSTNYRNFKRETDLSLKTQDIQGCKANYCQVQPLMINTRTLFNQTNYIKDIKGTEVGSALNKFYVANRQTNPLKPEYQLLGVKNPNSHLFNGLSKVLDTKPKYHTNLIKKPESDSQLQSKVYPQITKMENYQSKLQQQQRLINQTKQSASVSSRTFRSQSSGQAPKIKPNVASQLNSLLKKM